MFSIHPELQDLGDYDEKYNEIGEANKENLNEFCIFIAEQKSENTNHTTKYDKQTFCKFCSKNNEKREVKDIIYPW